MNTMNGNEEFRFLEVNFDQRNDCMSFVSGKLFVNSMMEKR